MASAASRFIASAIELNMSIQDELICTIHQDLLENPICLPCFHRFCRNCIEQLISSEVLRAQIKCPNCNSSHKLDVNWKTRWIDTTLQSLVKNVRANEVDLQNKVINFVQNSYIQFGQVEQILKLHSISFVHNARLKNRFENCKKQLRNSNVITLLHGTDADSATGIRSQGFKIPDSFERSSSGAEGELKFGKAIYFAHTKKATEYGKNILVLTDCLLGKVQEKSSSVLKLTPEIVHRSGHDTIHFYSADEGHINQEWAIYRTDQCLPLCIIEYEMVNENDLNESVLIQSIHSMAHHAPDYQVLQSALFGTDNQCKAVLNYVTGTCFESPFLASQLTYGLLSRIPKENIEKLLNHQNETIRILFLRLLWHIGRRDPNIQFFFYHYFKFQTLINLLQSSYTDVSWRACGVLANMAACVADVRRTLTSQQILNTSQQLLQRSLTTYDKTCTLAVLNLLANVACSEFETMKKNEQLRNYINENVLDHIDEDIKDAGNRFFCNMIVKGKPTRDWLQAGYQETALAPDLKDH